MLISVVAYTLYLYRTTELTTKRGEIVYVWAFGLITALSTGVGVIPFLFTHKLPRGWLGAANAAAAGMMLSASVALVLEASGLAPCQPPPGAAPLYAPDSVLSLQLPQVLLRLAGAQTWRVVVGAMAGVAFMKAADAVLDKYEHLKVAGFDALDSHKMLLIMAVMTLHSFAEGVAIGVSFQGDAYSRLGHVVSATLAVHNVPEGLAIAIVMIPRGVDCAHTGMWAVLSSLPQPLMAVPAFLLVQVFCPVTPYGMAFAAGAMGSVAMMELIPEAIEGMGSTPRAVAVAVLTAAAMHAVEGML